jgi:hypothetical protein
MPTLKKIKELFLANTKKAINNEQTTSNRKGISINQRSSFSGIM